jgi:hypothetical protein
LDGATATDSKLFITVEAKVAKNLDARGAAEDWAKLWNLSAEPTATDVDGEVAWQVTVEPKPRKPVPTEAVFTSHRGYLYSLVGLAKGNDDCKDQVAQLRKSWKWIPIESTAKHLEFRDTPLEAFGGEFSIDIPLKTRCRPTKEPKRVLDLFVQDFEHNAPAFNAYIQIFDSPAARFASAEQQLADSTKAEYRMSESFEWHPIKSEYPRAITQTMKLPLDAQKGAATTFIIYSLVQLDHKRIVMIVFDIPRDDPSAVPAYEKAAQKMVESIAK